MEKIYLDNPHKIRAIGVCNCSTVHLEQLLKIATVVPAVNQVELHPSLPQKKLAQYCYEKGIQLVAHSPLGSSKTKLTTTPELVALAARLGISVAQCMLSWGLKQGWPILPKSVSLNIPRANYSTKAHITITIVKSGADKRKYPAI